MRVTKTHFHFTASGGERSAPHGLPIPDNATDVAYDPETMTLTYTTPADPEVEGSEPQAHEMSVTQTQIDDAESAANTPPPPAVPDRVSKAQLKLALLAQGIDLPTLIAGLPEADQAAAQILVDDATEFRRAANMVATLGAIAGLTSDQIDDLFIAAAQIDPAQF